jgi:hypothetical protein
MTTFDFELSDHHSLDRAFVTVDDRFDVAIIRTADGLTIEVRPITDGAPWIDPCDRLEVDEGEIRDLEREIGHD